MDVAEVVAPLGGDTEVPAVDEVEFLGGFADAAIAERFVVALVSADKVEAVPAVIPLGEVLDAAGGSAAADQCEGGDGRAHAEDSAGRKDVGVRCHLTLRVRRGDNGSQVKSRRADHRAGASSHARPSARSAG